MRRTPPRVGLNLIDEEAFRVAALPLFEAGLQPEHAADRRPVRMDSHDGAMPRAEVLPLLAMAVARCAQLEVVVFERRGELGTEAEREAYREDFRAVHAAVEQAFACPVTSEEHAA